MTNLPKYLTDVISSNDAQIPNVLLFDTKKQEHLHFLQNPDLELLTIEGTYNTTTLHDWFNQRHIQSELTLTPYFGLIIYRQSNAYLLRFLSNSIQTYPKINTVRTYNFIPYCDFLSAYYASL